MAVGDTSSKSATKRRARHGLAQKHVKGDFILILRKKGCSYSLSGRYGTQGQADHKTFETESLKMLRAKKDLIIAVGLMQHGRDHQGEGNAMIDYVRVRSPVAK